MKYFDFLRFKKEAYLFDSRIYIIKSFLAIITAYLIALQHPLLRLDMISILFGLMMTLEPVTISGIKSGWEQIYATVIGAVTTLAIIYFFGINGITVALSVSFTLYVCIHMNWRFVSPVAIFTAIYMTQYVQKTVEGKPSPVLTFRLRIVALIFGVSIAILYNYLFSVFSYKKLAQKRLLYILDKSKEVISNMVLSFNNYKNDIEKAIIAIKECDNTIEWVLEHINDIEKDITYNRNRKTKIIIFKTIIEKLKEINRINNDSCYYLQNSNNITGKYIQRYKEIEKNIEDISKAIIEENSCLKSLPQIIGEKEHSNRLEENLFYIDRLINEIIILLKENRNINSV
ncbi:MAG: FUSC family protein [Eubacteriales bacterium]